MPLWPRAFAFVLAALALFLAACQASAPAAPTTSATRAPSASTPSPTAAALVRPAGSSQGELRVADNFILGNPDPDVQGAFFLMGYGVAETLMRVTPTLGLEPGLAARLEQPDPLTTVVTLRDDVTFHDGSKMDAEAVKASLERSIEKQPGTANLIPPGTRFTAEGQRLTITTPTPAGLIANSLAATNFTIKKASPDGTFFFTGPFKLTDFVARQSATMTAYDGYRGGPPRLKTIQLREIPDVAARVLALQAGDVDLAQALLPSDIAGLKAANFQVLSFPFSRQDAIILNVTRAPLDDPAVRRAVALAVDRDALVRGVMDGAGSPATGLAPSNLGLSGVLATQKFDLAEARTVLEAAGWAPGPDGIRAKGGRRLTFVLGSYAQRAELEPLSVAIRDQLKAVGIDAALTKFTDINTTVATSAFDTTMYSFPTVPYADLAYTVGALYTPSSTNKDRYSNPRVNDLFAQYGQTVDPAQRRELMRQLQELVGQDVPLVYVLNPNQIVAMSSRVKNYTPHPLENYKITADTSLQ